MEKPGAIVRPSDTLKSRHFDMGAYFCWRKTFSSLALICKFYIRISEYFRGFRASFKVAIKMQLAMLSVRLKQQGSRKMINSVLERLFGCSHRRTSFPITPKRPSARVGAYVSCLDCGKEFAYNWNEMRQEEQLVVPTTPVPPNRLVRPAEGLSRLLRLGN